MVAEITKEQSNDESLLININQNIVNSNVLSDNSGNQNLGFVISDKIVDFDEKTLSIKKSKRFEKVKRFKNNGAF